MISNLINHLIRLLREGIGCLHVGSFPLVEQAIYVYLGRAGLSVRFPQLPPASPPALPTA